MTKVKKIVNNIERRTYIKGYMKAMYIGFIDNIESDNNHKLYDIEILEATVEVSSENIIKWQDGSIFEEFHYLDRFPSQLPVNTDFCIIYESGLNKHFKIKLLDVRIKDAVITDRTIEDGKVFGTLTGTIYGYFLHYDQEESFIEGEEENLDPYHTNEAILITEKKYSSLTKSLVNGLFSALGLLIIIPIILYSWPLIAILAFLHGLSYLSSVIPKTITRVASIFNTILLLLIALLLVLGVFSLLRHGIITPVAEYTDQKDEQSNILPIPQQDSTQTTSTDSTNLSIQDSLIMHYRKWNGYNGESYSGFLSVRVSDLRQSTNHRNLVLQPVNTPSGFGEVFSGLDTYNGTKLTFLYSLFDSIKQTDNLSRTQFAEMVVSCIQDIPYTLILEHECSPWKYQDAFVRNYLISGGKCRPFVKYGVLSPVEFIATLDGDCDTRSLLLYSVLKNYEYDVTLLISNHYQHAILGINLPYRGLAKKIDGKRYVVWETTAKDIPPGELPSQMSNMNLWIPILISNQ
jgi:hypothetical protein